MGTNRFILLVGATGCGKTWVMRQLITKLKLVSTGRVGMFLFHQNSECCVLGKYDGTVFEGSDRLSMALMRDLDLFLSVKNKQVVICEGDRFTNNTFIGKVKPYVIKITDSGEAGRKLRKSNQTERQIKSIQTRVSKVRSDLDVADSNQALREILKRVKQLLN